MEPEFRLEILFLAIGRPLLSAIVAAAVAAVVVLLLPDSFSAVGRLLLGVTVLLATFVGMLFYAMGQKAFYLDLVRSMTHRATQEDGSNAGVI